MSTISELYLSSNDLIKKILLVKYSEFRQEFSQSYYNGLINDLIYEIKNSNQKQQKPDDKGVNLLTASIVLGNYNMVKTVINLYGGIITTSNINFKRNRIIGTRASNTPRNIPNITNIPNNINKNKVNNNSKMRINTLDKFGYCPIHYAIIHNNNEQIIKLLILNGADLNMNIHSSSNLHNYSNDTPLHLEIYELINLSKILRKIDLNKIDNVFNIINLLIKNGANVNKKNSSTTTEYYKNKNGKFRNRVISRNVKNDPGKVNNYYNKLNGAPPLYHEYLYYIPINYLEKLIKLFINNGANLNIKDNNGNNFLQIILLYENIGIDNFIKIFDLVLDKIKDNNINNINKKDLSAVSILIGNYDLTIHFFKKLALKNFIPDIRIKDLELCIELNKIAAFDILFKNFRGVCCEPQTQADQHQGFVEIPKALLGSAENKKNDDFIMSLLKSCILHDRFIIMYSIFDKYTVEKCINLQDNDGLTVFLYSVLHCKADILNLIITKMKELNKQTDITIKYTVKINGTKKNLNALQFLMEHVSTMKLNNRKYKWKPIGTILLKNGLSMNTTSNGIFRAIRFMLPDLY